MNGKTVIRIELDVAAQQILSQRMMQNEELDKIIEKAVQRAIDDFDFERQIYDQTTKALEAAVLGYESRKFITNSIQEKTQVLIEKQISEFIDKVNKVE